MKRRVFGILCFVVLLFVCLAGGVSAETGPAVKLDPGRALQLLQEGNLRFHAGTPSHPNTSAYRIYQAGVENQGDHAFATVITCSDSRVPVERIFDTGVMDTFVIRVAGNVMDTDEAGSIEYGLAHVHTPVLVVLGHTQCGAVTAVTHAVQGHGHGLERNIPPLVDNIIPAVNKTITAHPDLQGDDIIPLAIVENVWQGIEDLFLKSPASRDLYKQGKVKIVGAIYDVGTGLVEWLPEARVQDIFAEVEQNPGRAMNAMADDAHESPGQPHQKQHESTTHEGAGQSLEISPVKVTLADSATLSILGSDLMKSYQSGDLSEISHGFSSLFWSIVAIIAFFVLIMMIAIVTKQLDRMGLRLKMFASFGSLLLLATILGGGSYLNLLHVSGVAQVDTIFKNLELKAGKVRAAQNSFLLHGIENKAFGETQVAEITSNLQSVKSDLAAVSENDRVTGEQLTAIAALKNDVDNYELKTRAVVAAFHEIEAKQAILEESGSDFEEELNRMAEHHEASLRLAEQQGTDIAAIKHQSSIVEHLLTMEVRGLRLSHAQARFLLEKDAQLVSEMEKELGMFKGYLEAVERQIKDQKELSQLQSLGVALGKYENALRDVIRDEAVIGQDTAEMDELMQGFYANAGELSHEMEMQAGSTVKEATTTIIMLNIIMLVIGIIMAIYLTRKITGPILQSVNFAEAIAAGDLTRELVVTQKDETGLLVGALTGMNVSLRQMMTDITSGASELLNSSRLLNSTAEGMAESSEKTSGAASTVAAAAEEMSVNMSSVAAAAEQASTNVNLVAAAAEEMNSTISEITQNTAQTSSMTMKAVDQASRASDKVNELGQAAQEISKVTETITEISEQTNLLALNATIEAARAGEAGKGFAVVANEIKELARQTAQATMEIREKIEGVQNSTHATVKEITEILEVINDVNSMASTVAAAIEEQSAATREIASNVAQASQGIQEVTENVSQSSVVARDIAGEISGIDRSASALNTSSSEILRSAEQLSQFADSLRNMVSKFKVS